MVSLGQFHKQLWYGAGHVLDELQSLTGRASMSQEEVASWIRC